MVKGLENDEIDFLETVSRHKEREEEEKVLEEKLLLAEYKVWYCLWPPPCFSHSCVCVKSTEIS